MQYVNWSYNFRHMHDQIQICTTLLYIITIILFFSLLVSHCLRCLQSILPIEIVTDLGIAYYKSFWIETDVVWNKFETWLLACMGITPLKKLQVTTVNNT